MLHSRTDKVDTQWTKADCLHSSSDSTSRDWILKQCTTAQNQSNNLTSGVESYVDVYIARCVLNPVFSLWTLTGSFFVLSAIRRTPTWHKPRNILLLRLSLSDLAVSLFDHCNFYLRSQPGKISRFSSILRFIQAFFIKVFLWIFRSHLGSRVASIPFGT